MTATATVPSVQNDVSSWRLIFTLTAAGAIVGLCIVLIYQVTQPIVERHKAAELHAAIQEVLRSPTRYDTLWLRAGVLARGRPTADEIKKAERVYLGYDRDGARSGFAITAAQPGFADAIQLIFGYDAARERLLGMKILDSKETPGIADKIGKPVFTDQFREAGTPLQGVKARAGNDPHQVVMITGATISSRAVIKAINKSVTHWQPLLVQYLAKEPGVTGVTGVTGGTP